MWAPVIPFITDRKLALFILVLVAFLLRLGFIATFHNEVVFGPEAPHYEYVKIARNLAAGRGFSLSGPTALQTPIYPMLLSVFYRLGPEPFATFAFLTFQAFLSSLTALIVYYIAARLLPWRLALLAAAGVALYPLFIYYSASPTPMTLAGLLLTATVCAWYGLVGSGGLGKTIVAGLLLGFTVLNDPVYLATVPLFLGWLWLQEWKTSGSRVLHKLVVVVVTIVVVLSPWLIRNYLTFGVFPLLKPQLGLTLWRGYYLYSTWEDFYKADYLAKGEEHARRGIFDMRERFPESFLRDLDQLPEVDRDRRLLGLALSFIRENPGQASRVFLRKLGYFWWFAPIATTAQREEMRQYLWIHKASYGVVLVLALLGLFRLRTRMRELTLLLALMAAVSVVYAVTYVGMNRYRAPIEILLIILAAGGVSLFGGRGEPNAASPGVFDE